MREFSAGFHQATNAAAEFVASEDSLEKLFKKFPSRPLPYFSALLKTARLNRHTSNGRYRRLPDMLIP
ncbi:MAG: hypothetical protein WBE38_04380 [Terracidiphilus sp.]